MNRICLIIHSLGIGGMERVMAQLANNFAGREDVQVHLLLIGIKRNVEYPINDSIYIHRPYFTFQNSRRSIDTIRTMRFIRLTVKDINPDTILSFGEMWNNLVLLSLYGLNVPIYVSDRSQPDKDLGNIQNMLRNKLYPRAKGYIAQTEKAAEICRDNEWNSNIKVIGNPVRKVKNDQVINKENIVLMVGRLIPTKHVDQLIKIFSEIDKPGWKLVIVGGDAKKMNLSKELSELIEELGVGESVFLEGQQKDVDQYYNRSKVFAFTSSSEGFPNVIGEALSAGLPVVAYDCLAGPSEMIKDEKNGFLVPLFDKKLFKEKLSILMDCESLRLQMSKAAQNSIERFNKSLISDRFYNFICDI